MTWILKLLGFDPVGKIVDGIARWKEIQETARNDSERIRADLEIKRLEGQISVVTTGMQTKVFWIPWLVATIPTTLWFGWGMLDSLCNGALPDVAELPPQLKAYADVVWQNIFYTGVAGVGIETLGRVLRR